MKSLVILLPLLLGSTLALQPDGGHGFMTEEHRADRAVVAGTAQVSGSLDKETVSVSAELSQGVLHAAGSDSTSPQPR